MQPSLFDAPADDPLPSDQAARDFAVDPANDVVLEASAGTGKTRVLVDRYVRLIEAGVDPRHILAITFTRKAAAEMRDRVLAALRLRAAADARMRERWTKLGDRVAEIQISTIDAFCFGLLREFPLEADVDPGFEIADETEMARFQNEAIDLTLRASRGLIGADEQVRLLFTRVKLPVLRDALITLIDRRHVALPAVATFVKRRVRVTGVADVSAAFVARVRDLLARSPHHRALIDDGPLASPEFRWLHGDLLEIDAFPVADAGRVHQLRRRLERYFLTRSGTPRQRLTKPFTADQFVSAGAKKRHEAALGAVSPDVLAALEALESDVNGLLARGLLRVLTIAVEKYDTLLEEHALLDFAGMLARAVALLERQEEFARSRLKLQSRYHHVLVDEFQDTSRLQWRLVELLIDAWREGEGSADAPTSIFVVGDRKQSIYRFRHAEVTLLDEAARKIAALRPGREARKAITHSFRAVPELLAFVNALADEMQGAEDIDERFSYGDADRFPAPDVADGARRGGDPVLGLIAEPSMAACAVAVAAEVQRLLETTMVRDRAGTRPARPDDVAILFRARAGHQYFEEALEARGIRTYVYKGLGFFDAPEVQDLQALMRCLAEPESDLRCAELLRSRFIRLSDVGLTRLAPSFARALWEPRFDAGDAGLDAVDAPLLERARASVARWLAKADRVAPSQLIDEVLRESAYAYELRGRRLGQARENVKKVRTLVRRVENRGYATLGRLADYFETLRAGDESNAIIEAAGCVNLMTVHAAKGLEFPIVFLVNIHVQGRGRSTGFSVVERGADGEPEVAFGSSAGTRLEDQRETEELRRLLYVAATRARDRLYLATEVDKKSKLKRGGRSLAALLPVTLADQFGVAAASAADEVVWQSRAGAFAFRVCRPSVPPASSAPAAPAQPVERPDLTPIAACGPTVDVASAGDAPPAAGTATGRRRLPAADERLVGTLVHRLIQQRLDRTLTADEVAARVPALLRRDEGVDVEDVTTLASQAAGLFFALARREDVVAILAGGECHYELPFSYRPPDREDDTGGRLPVSTPGVVRATIVRGTVDCLVVRPDGRATVLEFKTGAPRPEHDAQVSVYLQALGAALPDLILDARLVYP